jgi:hypothetical protein
MGRKAVPKTPLDDLVLKVCHLELADCENFSEFRECILLMKQNLEQTLAALSCYEPADRRAQRATENVKQQAIRLLQLCDAVPESFDDPQRWREMAMHIAANYEQFRIDAGHLYQVVVPESTFDILRSAL